MYVNISEKYGDGVKVTIDDYRELNPDGDFYEDSDGISESGEIIAVFVDETVTLHDPINGMPTEPEQGKTVGNVWGEVDGYIFCITSYVNGLMFESDDSGPFETREEAIAAMVDRYNDDMEDME